MFGWARNTRSHRANTSSTPQAFEQQDGGVMSGLVIGTRVATEFGWRDIGAIAVGDEVLTFDNGAQQVTEVRRTFLWSGQGACPRQFWPLLVPTGVLDNVQPMTVLPHQAVMLESDCAEEVFGDPFALVQAEHLEGVHGVERVYPNQPIEVISIRFAHDNVVFAEGGSLFLCPAVKDIVASAVNEGHEAGIYRLLSRNCAANVVQAGIVPGACRA